MSSAIKRITISMSENPVVQRGIYMARLSATDLTILLSEYKIVSDDIADESVWVKMKFCIEHARPDKLSFEIAGYSDDWIVKTETLKSFDVVFSDIFGSDWMLYNSYCTAHEFSMMDIEPILQERTKLHVDLTERLREHLAGQGLVREGPPPADKHKDLMRLILSSMIEQKSLLRSAAAPGGNNFVMN